MNLQEYLSAYLGDLETQLGYSASSLDLVVTETLAVYGVDTEEEVTDTQKLYALGRYFLWRKVLRDLSLTGFDYSADGVSLKRSQIIENVREQYKQAVADAMPYLPSNKVVIYKTNHIHGCLSASDEFGRLHYEPYYER